MCFHRFERFSAATLSFPAAFFSDHRPTLSPALWRASLIVHGDPAKENNEHVL
jgi:hypothetical protein